ncbi:MULTISPECIES: type IV toxin-antitoxin system AbiEi family antitoxin [Rhodococcus]|uniref:type IV toxin-antitoxin system AbiEi family antitoxin n=1 Tax=Rhodococcus TaxID=1827 RepID=UPI0009ECCC1A|nr:type IV toxin-antitoxin system AbiEi family antitoxin [Rhodococcus phenolicus]
MDQRVHNLAELLPELLSSVGLELTSLHWVTEPDRGFEAKAVLSRRGNVQHYALVFAAAMTLTQITHLRPPEIDAPLLVVGKRITERSATAFRDQKIQYIDTLGNAYIEFGDVYVDVRGRRPSTHTPDARSKLPTHRAHDEWGLRLTHNLFSPRRSQVVFALLTWPQLTEMKIRDIANASGVSIGQAHDTLNLLEEAGFLRRGVPLRPYALHEILQPWALEYPRGLRKRLTLARFYTDEPTHFQPLRPDQEFFFSGESAEGVDIQHPTTLTVYVEHFDRKLAFVNRWRDDPDQVPNVRVLQKFWTPPDEHPGSEDSKRDGPPNAPWPLVYADLLALNDPRLREVAETWRTLCSI